MKVLFLVRSLEYGGAERQLLQLALELNRNGVDVVIVTSYSGGAFETCLSGSGVTLESLDKHSRWDAAAIVIRLGRLLRRHKPDVVHGYGRTGNLAALAARLVLPRSEVIWGVRDSNMELANYRWPARVADRAATLLSRFAHLIIVNSQSGLEHCKARGYPSAKLVHVPNGIDTALFRPRLEDGERLRASWGVEPHERLVGLIGRLDPMKDHPTFLRAAAAIAPLRQDVRFVCLGGGSPSYQAQLVELCSSLGLSGRVLWKGPHADVTSVYNALDVVCSASSYGEGFPNVVGEAMACARPCVVTDTGDSAFVAGRLARVVQARNPQALATAVRDSLPAKGAPRIQALGARKRIGEMFSVEKLGARTLLAFEKRQPQRWSTQSSRAAAGN